MPTLARLGPTMAALLLLAVGASAAPAADAPHRWHPAPWQPPVRATAPRPAFATGAAGMMIAHDPETGTWGMPSRLDELVLSEAEENMLSRSSAGLMPVYLPDGSVMLDLQGRFQEFVIARVGPDGRVHQDCVSETAAARGALAMPAAPTAPVAPAAPVTTWEER